MVAGDGIAYILSHGWNRVNTQQWSLFLLRKYKDKKLAKEKGKTRKQKTEPKWHQIRASSGKPTSTETFHLVSYLVFNFFYIFDRSPSVLFFPSSRIVSPSCRTNLCHLGLWLTLCAWLFKESYECMSTEYAVFEQRVLAPPDRCHRTPASSLEINHHACWVRLHLYTTWMLYGTKCIFFFFIYLFIFFTLRIYLYSSDCCCMRLYAARLRHRNVLSFTSFDVKYDVDEAQSRKKSTQKQK